jgi:hypothetical protein
MSPTTKGLIYSNAGVRQRKKRTKNRDVTASAALLGSNTSHYSCENVTLHIILKVTLKLHHFCGMMPTEGNFFDDSIL